METILIISEKVESDIVYVTDGRRRNSRGEDDFKFPTLMNSVVDDSINETNEYSWNIWLGKKGEMMNSVWAC